MIALTRALTRVPIRENRGVIFLIIVAVVAVSTAIAHLSCIYFGPECYAAQMAPPEFVQSAKEGTLLAPLGTLFVSGLFLVVALYALSSANLIRTLPFLTIGVYTISIMCVLRGLATIPSSILFPDMVSVFSILAGLVWLITGLLLYFGHRAMAR